MQELIRGLIPFMAVAWEQEDIVNEHSKATDKFLYILCDPDGHLLDSTKGILKRLAVSKRWLKGNLGLHMHLWVRSRCGESQAQDLCLTFSRDRTGGPSIF